MTAKQRQTQLYHWGCALAACIAEGRLWSVVSTHRPGTRNTFLAGVTPQVWRKAA